MDPSIAITLNGQSRTVPAGTTVRELIELLGLGKAACAAEVNKELVPHRQHAQKEIAEGDQIEIVSLVGGG